MRVTAILFIITACALVQSQNDPNAARDAKLIADAKAVSVQKLDSGYGQNLLRTGCRPSPVPARSSTGRSTTVASRPEHLGRLGRHRYALKLMCP